MNLQPAVAIIKEAQLSELVHEKTDARPDCADHLSEGLLTDSGDYRLGRTFLAEVSKQQQKPGQRFFAGIEKLIDQVLFVPDVSRQQIRYEQIGECVFPVKRKHHRLLINAQKFAIRYCGCRPHA